MPNEASEIQDKKDLDPKPESKRHKKVKKVIEGAYDLSLGISIVVAIIIGVALGFLMKKVFGVSWVFWLGVFWGVGAAILNISKAYKRTKKELEALANDPKYTYKKENNES